MPDNLPRDPARAVRRAATEQLSFTVLGGSTAIIQAVAQGVLTTEQQELMQHATSLVEAFAQLAGVTYSQALADLMEAATALHQARKAADQRWTAKCIEAGQNNVATLRWFRDAADPIVQAFATAADMPYGPACQTLYERHYVYCDTHL